MRWFSRGDLDGFFGLAIDNLVQLLLIYALWTSPPLSMKPDLLFQYVLPGVAVSLLIGNLFYAWQAKKLADATGRTDVCALPYGINTPSLIAYIFLVMVPAKMTAVAAGSPDPDRVAWQAGLAACIGSGLIEFFGSFVAERIRKATPRAALLATLSGIALGFICLGFFFQTFAHPIVGFTTLAVILLTYFGNVRFKGGLPGGLVAVALGTALAWATGIAGTVSPDRAVGFYPPTPIFDDLLSAFGQGQFVAYLSVIIPMGVFNLIGSLQNIESAEAAGDPYPTAPSLAVNGLGTLAAACFGSCFPTTIYIGHPGWKALGARAGYSILNGLFFTVVCLTGTLTYIAYAVPMDAGLAIVVWIGIVITAQAFTATPRAHAPAVVIGLLPAVAAWGVLMMKNGIRAAGDVMLFKDTDKLVQALTQAGVGGADGGLRLEQGFIFTCMILAALTVAVIEGHFRAAALWCVSAALLTLVGLMHSYQGHVGDTSILLTLQPEYPFLLTEKVPRAWVAGYLLMGLVFFAAPWITEPGGAHDEPLEEPAVHGEDAEASAQEP
ncbi:MAG: NCS2 family permease [Gemmataceae bacterium]